jgi:hypothetical protein
MKLLLLSTLMTTTFGLAAMADAPGTLSDAQMDAVHAGQVPTDPPSGLGNYTASGAGAVQHHWANEEAAPQAPIFVDPGAGRNARGV